VPDFMVSAFLVEFICGVFKKCKKLHFLIFKISARQFFKEFFFGESIVLRSFLARKILVSSFLD